MPGPGPRLISSINAANQRAVEVVVEDYAGRATAPSAVEPVATGADLDNANSICRQAGVADWPTMRARSITVGKRILGQEFVPQAHGSKREIMRADPQRVRAWAALYAADLIDPAMEQPGHAVTWGWW